MFKSFNNGVWTAIQILVVGYDKPTLAAHIVKECGLSREDCTESQLASGLENETMQNFINAVFPIINDRHCSQCKHYEICPNCIMYCHVLGRRITARKRPCKHYEVRE